MKIFIFIFAVVLTTLAQAQSTRCGGGLAAAAKADEPKTRGCLSAQRVVEALTDETQIEAFGEELRNLGTDAIQKSCKLTTNSQTVEVSGQICGGNQGKACYFVTMLTCVHKNKSFPMAMQGGCQSQFCGSFATCMKDQSVDTNLVVFAEAPKPEAADGVVVKPNGELEIRR